MHSPDFTFFLPQIAEHLGLKRAGHDWRGRCPLCGIDALSLAGNGPKLLANCFAGCDGVAIFNELRKRELIHTEPHRRVVGPACAPRAVAPPATPPSDWSERAERIWNLGLPFKNTPLETYLVARGCLFAAVHDIRFLPAHAYGPYACMMARVTDAVTAKPISLHFTRLAADGRGKASCPRPKRLLAGHRKSGGVIRLVADAEVTQALGLAEGIETALSVMAAGWAPVWATVDAGNMAAFPILNGIEALTLFADNDESGTGRRSAEECAARWRKAGRDAAIVMPQQVGTDWNDQIRGAA